MFEKEAEERITEQYGTSGEYITRQRIWQEGAEFGYNKAMEEMQEKGLALQSDMDRTIEQNLKLKKRNSELAGQKASLERWFGEAKKIIGNLYAICKDNHYPNSSVLMEQAEQFLKEFE
jgi:vacuolar-type H+-ATPase subunit E/Vma4